MSEAETALRAMAAQIEALEQRLAEQQQDLLQQRAEVAALRAQLDGTTPATESAAVVPVEPAATGRRAARHTTSRRHLFATAGAAAAVATAAAVLVEPGQVAHAASGDNLVLGSANNAGNMTALENSSGFSPGTLLEILNETTGGDAIDCFGGSGGKGVFASCDGSGSFGVFGETDVGTGVSGTSNSSGNGVSGTSDSGVGVLGTSTSGIGIFATSSSDVALLADSTSAAGIVAEGGTYGAVLQGALAPLELTPFSFAGAPSTGTYTKGDILVDKNGVVWTCVANGTPGAWARLASVHSTATGGATTYLTKPIRLLDTRSGATDALFEPGAPYAGGSTHSLLVAGDTFSSVTVPAGALGAIGNVTVVNPTGSGYLALVPHSAGFSGTAILAFTAGQVVSNSFNVGLSAGQLDIIIGGSSTTDVILDLFAVVL